MSYAHYPSLKNKTVFITGGTSGIGADFVLQFAQQGANVAFVGRNKKNGEQVVSQIEKKCGVTPLYMACDITHVDEIHRAVNSTLHTFGSIDILINNAANDQRHKTEELTEPLWHELMGINLTHQFFTAQAVLPSMIHKKNGSIINISSNCYLLSEIPQYPAYATAKSAIIGMTRALAYEFGKYDIRVNCILPGWVMTEKQITLWLTPEAEEKTLQEQSLKHKLMPEDISRLALFLAADDSKMITKQVFIVDGGRV